MDDFLVDLGGNWVNGWDGGGVGWQNAVKELVAREEVNWDRK